MTDEKIILNIGGIKYETLRSTLVAQPETLLGTMFRDKNEYVKNSVNGNEYFFDRNGEAFYYIIEFYRTGKLLWPTETKKSQVTYKQLEEELDYFQIKKSKIFFSSLASEAAKSTINRFISVLEQLIINHYVNFDNKINLSVGKNDSRLSQFKGCDIDILNNVGQQIEKHFVETFSELGLKWKCQWVNFNHTYEIEITFYSPVGKLLESVNAQAHIAFTQTPINTSDENIILNVGGKKYETFRSTLTAQPKTLLGTMFQDRNKSMRHPINENEYFFDRNSEAFNYVMEFYQTGKITWPIESGKVTWKQIEEELDYFQIPFKKSTLLCSLALQTVRNKFNNLILIFEELIIHCCNYLRNNIELEISRGNIRINSKSKDRYKIYLEDLRQFCLSKFRFSDTYIILDNMEKQIRDHLVKIFYNLGLKWEFFRVNDYHKIRISFSLKNVLQ
ncbi:36512_t:CDS:2 [Gigaspora margarita]|uniref:36512_t:CDS:1 n=1 Tax=Gigaspora margarita TaxID=4874 RepID=A0ABN7V259_GIGMA|nr:36512_t:CDS:2 [Gigaspora margarita]